jgi:hypothetical protein
MSSPPGIDPPSPLGLITHSGRILTAKLLVGLPVGGITHCALGDGDGTFVDPLAPPAPSVDQVALVHERVRKRFWKRTFLVEDPAGGLRVNGVAYSESPKPTPIIGVFFRFEEAEANGLTVKEYGFFGGGVEYVSGWTNDLAREGLHHPDTNPDGQVAVLGDLYEVKNIPDFHKTSDTRLELVGVIKL